MWIVEYLPNEWRHDEPRDGYLVYDEENRGNEYAYYPNGKDYAEKFAKLCNDKGEKVACSEMGYVYHGKL